MKNRLPFAALTVAFTIAGAALGYAIENTEALVGIVIFVAGAGGIAAAASGIDLD